MCPFTGVTKFGRVWRKVPENDARSVMYSNCGWQREWGEVGGGEGRDGQNSAAGISVSTENVLHDVANRKK